MSRKHDLRIQRTGTVINLTSKRQEKRLGNSLRVLSSELEAKFEIRLHHEKQWLLKDANGRLRFEHHLVWERAYMVKYQTVCRYTISIMIKQTMQSRTCSVCRR